MQEYRTRKNIRLEGYDYSKNGYYFVTMCTQDRECILAKIENNVGAGPVSARVKLTYTGNIIEETLLKLEEEFNNIKIHDYIIMPNHIHVIIEIYERADTGPAPTLPQIICSYKTRTTGKVLKKIKRGDIEPFDKRLWQRNYYEHIIRNENEYLKIKEYIINNPYNWKDDEYY